MGNYYGFTLIAERYIAFTTADGGLIEPKVVKLSHLSDQHEERVIRETGQFLRDRVFVGHLVDVDDYGTTTFFRIEQSRFDGNEAGDWVKSVYRFIGDHHFSHSFPSIAAMLDHFTHEPTRFWVRGDRRA
tara:strand:- start:87 stop:476 length:390 start_codon:yes stop_codon:yes gene_type:complete